MRDNAQYEAKLVAELNCQTKTKIEHIGEDVAFLKLNMKHDIKDIRKLQLKVRVLYGLVSLLLLGVFLLALNMDNLV